MSRAKEKGDAGEQMAVEYLLRKGYELIARNYRKRGCEADIIAKDGDTLVIAEVKARSACGFQSGGEAITKAKRRRVTQAALSFLSENALGDVAVRFDALLIGLSGEIEHIVGAFDAEL